MNKKEVVEKFKEKGIVPRERRNLTRQETEELRQMQYIAGTRRFEAEQVKNNTTLIPNGKKVAEQLDAIATLLENIRNQQVAQKLFECGYEQKDKCQVDLLTGAVTVVE